MLNEGVEIWQKDYEKMNAKFSKWLETFSQFFLNEFNQKARWTNNLLSKLHLLSRLLKVVYLIFRLIYLNIVAMAIERDLK